MPQWIQTMTQTTNPYVLLVVLLLGGGLGTGGVSFYTKSAFATEDYVNTRIDSLTATMEYNFVLSRRDKLDEVVWGLKNAKHTNPESFTSSDERRLHEKTVKLQDTQRELDMLHSKINGN